MAMWKEPVRAASTANLTLSGAQTIDGVSVLATERVLVKNQTLPAENGIYVAAAGAWARATDMDADNETLAGSVVVVAEGTTQADTAWELTTNDPIVVGTTALTFALLVPDSMWKAPVRAASTANLTLSGAQTIDGVSVIAGDRVLVKNQTTGSENGIYVAAAGAWARSMDANSSAKVLSGLAVFVTEGSTQADTLWQLTTDNPITLGSTALTFAALIQPSMTKAPVRAATTANITLSGAQTIDGVSIIAGDRVLVKAQTTGSENGIYVAAAGAWARAADADTSAEVTAGMTVAVTEGTLAADTVWELSTDNPITLGSTALVFTQMFGTSEGRAFLLFGMTTKVPAAGTRYMSMNGVISSKVGVRILRACNLTGASLQVNAVDATRAYKLSIRKNGVEAASVALSTSTLGNHSDALNVALVAGDLLSAAIVKTSSTGVSTFSAATAMLELSTT